MRTSSPWKNQVFAPQAKTRAQPIELVRRGRAGHWRIGRTWRSPWAALPVITAMNLFMARKDRQVARSRHLTFTTPTWRAGCALVRMIGSTARSRVSCSVGKRVTWRSSKSKVRTGCSSASLTKHEEGAPKHMCGMAWTKSTLFYVQARSAAPATFSAPCRGQQKHAPPWGETPPARVDFGISSLELACPGKAVTAALLSGGCATRTRRIRMLHRCDKRVFWVFLLVSFPTLRQKRNAEAKTSEVFAWAKRCVRAWSSHLKMFKT